MAVSVYKVEVLRLQSFPIQKVLEYISNSETDVKFINISKWCHVLYVVYTGLFDIPVLVLLVQDQRSYLGMWRGKTPLFI